MLCPNCGKNVVGEFTFCPFCGAEASAENVNSENGTENISQENTSQPSTPKIPSKVGCRLRTLLYIALLFVLVVNLLGTLTVRFIINGNTVVNAVSRVEFDKVDISGISDGKYNSLSELIADEADEEKVTVQAATNILKEANYQEFLGNYADNLAEYIVDGSELEGLKPSQIIDAVKANQDLIFKETGILLTQKEYDGIEAGCKSYLDNLNKSVEQAIGPDSAFGSVLPIIRPFLSIYAIIIAAVLIAGIIALYIIDCIRHRMSVSTSLTGIGVTFIVSSLPFISVWAVSRWLLEQFIPKVQAFILPLIYSLMDKFLLTGLISVIIGIIAITIGIVLRIMQKRKIKKQA